MISTNAAYPNEESFFNTNIFCFLVKKLIRSCNGDRRTILDKKHPKLCKSLVGIENYIFPLDCQNYEKSEDFELVNKNLKGQFARCCQKWGIFGKFKYIFTPVLNCLSLQFISTKKLEY